MAFFVEFHQNTQDKTATSLLAVQFLAQMD